MNRFPWLSTLRPKVLDLWHRGRRKLRPMFHSAKAKLWLFAGIVIKRGRPLLGKLGSLFVVLWHHLLPLIHRCTSWNGFWWITGIAVVLAIGVYLSWRFWDDLQDGPESLSTTIRNLGLVIGGVIAILLAVWRSVVGSSQADTAQRDLLNERYQKGAEMLGSNVLSVRLGGVYALQRLAEEHPDQYHIQTMKLLCAFARHPTRVEDEERELLDNDTEGAAYNKEDHGGVRRLRPDVQAVIEAIATLNEARILLEREAEYVPNLSDADLRNLRLDAQNLSRVELVGADLSGARLYRTNFSHAKLYDAILSCARLNGANFSNAKVDDANLSGVTAGFANFSDVYFFNVNLAQADLSSANVTGARFLNANLSGAKFSKNTLRAEGLGQGQLDRATADPSNPPILDGLIDSQTGKPLVWRGKPLDDKS